MYVYCSLCSFYSISCLAPLSLSIVSISLFPPRRPIHQLTLRAPAISLPQPTFSSSPRLLSILRSPPFLYSPMSLGLRDLFLFISFPIMSVKLCFALLDAWLYHSSFASLSHICLANLLLTSSYHLVSVVFISLSVSMFHICPSFSCRHSTFLASNLFMFSLVLQ